MKTKRFVARSFGKPLTAAFAAAALLFSAPVLHAAADGGQNSADLLNIMPDAETVSLGGSAVAIDAFRPSVSFSNPAALTGIDRDEFSFFQAAYPAGLYYRYFGYGMPLPSGNLAISLSVMNYTGVDAYNSDFTKTILDDSYDAVVTAAYSFDISRKTPEYKKLGSIGIGAKFLESKLAYYGSEALAVDAGAIYILPFVDGMTAGLAVKNFGSDMKYVKTAYPLPSSVNVGLGYKNEEYESLIADFDYCFPTFGNAYYSCGLSVKPLYFFRLNAGYKETSDNLFTGASAGFGLEFGNFKLDYAFRPANDLGPVHFVSLSMDIGNIVNPRTAYDYYLDKHFRRAVAAYHRGDLIDARQQFEEILSIYPDHEPSRKYLDNLMKKVEKSSELTYKKINMYIEKARSAVDNNDFVTAKKYYNYVVSLNPDSEEARVGIENLWKSIEQARIEKEREVHRAEIEKLWNSANENYRNVNYVEAKKELNQILKIDPENQDVKNALVEIDSQLSKITASKISDIFEKGMELYSAESYREALSYFDAVVLAAPNRSDAKEMYAKCLGFINEEDRQQAAARLAKEQVAMKPQMDSLYDRALTYYERENYTTALDYFNKCEDLAKKYDFSSYMENIRKYQDIIRSTLAERHYKAGFEYYSNNKPEEAVGEYKKALSYNPDSSMTKEAIEKLNKELSQSYYEQGMSLFARGEMGRAKDMLTKSLEYEPGKLEAQRALDRIK